jgi:hypothetical protein
MAFTPQQTFDALSDTHHQVLGELLVMRNEFIHRCAIILLIAQFGITGRGIAGRSSFLHRALIRDSLSEMIKTMKALLPLCDDKTISPRFVSAVEPHLRLFEEIDRLMLGRWGLVDFTRPEKPVLYSDDPANLPSYEASDLKRLLAMFKEVYVELKPFLYPSDASPPKS